MGCMLCRVTFALRWIWSCKLENIADKTRKQGVYGSWLVPSSVLTVCNQSADLIAGLVILFKCIYCHICGKLLHTHWQSKYQMPLLSEPVICPTNPTQQAKFHHYNVVMMSFNDVLDVAKPQQIWGWFWHLFQDVITKTSSQQLFNIPNWLFYAHYKVVKMMDGCDLVLSWMSLKDDITVTQFGLFTCCLWISLAEPDCWIEMQKLELSKIRQ